MRSTSWPIAVVALGLLGTAVALAAEWELMPAATVVPIVPIVPLPLGALALSFVGRARTGAVRSAWP